jgi:hypothetical protein
VRGRDLHAETLLGGHPLDGLAHERLGTLEALGGRRADIDRELGEPWDHVEAARLDRDDSDVGGHVLAGARLLPQLQHDARGAGEGVAAPVHRGRARVVGRTQELHAEAEQPGDRRDDAQVLPALLENGALLDVEFEVGADSVDSARLGQAVEVEAGARHRIGDAAAPPVLEVELAAEGPAAEHPGLEAAALLVVEGHDPEGPPRLDPFRPQGADGCEGSQHAERAVVAAAARHRVEVRADEHRLPLPRVPAAEDVACRVELGFQAEVLEPAHEPVVRLRELWGPREAGDAAAVGADLRCSL